METPETETLLSGRPSTSFTLRLSPLLKSKTEAKARANGLSLAQTARLALACYLEPMRLYRRGSPTGIPCARCGRDVEQARKAYAIPHCYTCLPPPLPLETTDHDVSG